MKIIINAVSAKKSAGGAYQISINFIRESLQHLDVEWYWVVSQDIDDALGNSFNEYRGSRYFAFPTQPDFKHSYFKVKKELKALEKRINPDLIYSITAPSFFFFSTPEVMRYTKPWTTHPNQYVDYLLTPRKKLEIALQKHLMRKAQYFITQSQTCKEGIVRITGVDSSHVCVVSNVLPAAYRNADRTPFPCDGDWHDVACIGNPFVHKNFDILPEVVFELNKLGIDNVRFHVTIPEDNKVYIGIARKLEQYGLRGRVITHGRCSQQELIEIYRHCQFCYQPTLLEVFSASAIEAMFFGLPTVATDLSFNSEVFQDACIYCEPHNAKSAAEKFVLLIEDKDMQNDLRGKMKKRLAVYSDYDNHFNATRDFLVKVAEKRI